MAQPERICPLCDEDTEALLCKTCQVPTLDKSIFEEKPAPVAHGALIANRYQVEEMVGRGGQATVYRAVQVGMNRVVAIKTLDAELTGHPKQVKRFYLEVQAASKLDHPNVVRIMDFGIDTNTRLPFYVMEYLDGGTLSEVLTQGGPMPERRAAHLVAQVARALVAAHDAQIVHRDLKPQNITVQVLPDGEELVKVLDFGIAKLLQDDGGQGLTSTGDTLGTPLYMSPEQVRGGEITFRTDLYALGCILYQCMTGDPPFQARDAYGLVVRHLRHEPPALPQTLADGKAPTEVIRLLYRRLLEKAPFNRPGSTAEVATLLRRLAHGKVPDPIPDWLTANPALAETDGSSQLQFFPANDPSDNAATEEDSPVDLASTPPTVLDRPHSSSAKARDPSTPPPLPNDTDSLVEIAPELVVTHEGPATDLDRQANKQLLPSTKIWWAVAAVLMIASGVALWQIMDDPTKRPKQRVQQEKPMGESQPTHTRAESGQEGPNARPPTVVSRRAPNPDTPAGPTTAGNPEAKRPLHSDPKKAAETPMNTDSKENARPGIEKPSIKSIVLKSSPAGALVYQNEVRDGEEIGKTPFFIPHDFIKNSRQFILVRKGYKPLSITSDALHTSTKAFKLEKESTTNRRTRRKKTPRIKAWD